MTVPDLEPPLYDELIVICGPPRSGTTWLCRELCNAPGAYPFLPECTFLTQQIDLYHRTLHYGDRQRIQAYFGTDGNLRDFFRANVARLIEQAARFNRRNHDRILVLKDPNLSLYLPDIKNLLPSHKLIIIVRDPRDVLASMKNVALRGTLRWNAKATAEQLMNYYYQISSYQQHASISSILVRYEDLVSGQVTALRDFLQFPVLEAGSISSSVPDIGSKLDSSDPFFSELYLQPTTREKIGSFASILTRGEISEFERVNSGVIRQWGYPLISFRSKMTATINRLARGL